MRVTLCGVCVEKCSGDTGWCHEAQGNPDSSESKASLALAMP